MACANEGLGTLRSDEFEDVVWETDCPPAKMGDVLRVHEWSYIQNLQQVSMLCSRSWPG